MPLARAGNTKLEYYVDGSGPALLLVQGFTGRAQSWSQTLISELARDFTTIRFSHAGIGLSEAPKNAPTMQSMAGDAAALLTALGREKAHVFGISMGGVIAQQMAIHHPERVLGLVLGCTSCGTTRGPTADPEVLKALMDPSGTIEERTRRSWPYVMAAGWENNPDAVQAAEAELAETLEHPIPPALLIQHLVAMQQTDSYEQLPSLRMPALVLHGDADQLVNPQHGKVIAERIPGAELRIIPDTGHLFFNEQPRETVRILREFLARVPAAA